MKLIKNYFWFIKESQSFMKGHNPVLIFFRSIWKGIFFCKELKEWDRVAEKYGEEYAYLTLNHVMEI